jgi:hypothetical protein
VSLARPVTLVPSLTDLLADPSGVQALPPAVAADLLVQMAGLQERLRLRALTEPAPPPVVDASPDGGDRLLSVDDAARKLGVSPDWIYRRSRGDRRLPFLARLDGKLLCSAQGIDRYIRQRLAR